MNAPRTSARFAVFVSGRGSNFEALARAGFRDRIALVVSDRPEAFALEKARALDLPTFVSKDEKTILAELARRGISTVVLAGYLRILSREFVEAFRDPSGATRILNIHPSLLPAFPGLNAYAQAFDYGCKHAGVTVHLVEAEVDGGPILAQETFSIEDCASVSEVETRGLAIEHRLYAETLEWYLRGELHYETKKGRLCVSRI